HASDCAMGLYRSIVALLPRLVEDDAAIQHGERDLPALEPMEVLRAGERQIERERGEDARMRSTDEWREMKRGGGEQEAPHRVAPASAFAEQITKSRLLFRTVCASRGVDSQLAREEGSVNELLVPAVLDIDVEPEKRACRGRD